MIVKTPPTNPIIFPPPNYASPFIPTDNTSNLPNPTANNVGADLEELAGMHQSLLGNQGLLNTIAGTQGIPSFSPTENLEVKRPWLDEPVGAIPFDPQATIPLPAVLSPNFVIVANPGYTHTFVVPSGYDGVIKLISCNFTGGGFTQGSGDIIWQLRINGKPLLNFENILNEKGTFFQGREIGRIRVYSNQTIDWVVSHPSNLALNGSVICSLTGYVYPSRGN